MCQQHRLAERVARHLVGGQALLESGCLDRR
jgi:hypothetical protein